MSSAFLNAYEMYLFSYNIFIQKKQIYSKETDWANSFLILMYCFSVSRLASSIQMRCSMTNLPSTMSPASMAGDVFCP